MFFFLRVIFLNIIFLGLGFVPGFGELYASSMRASYFHSGVLLFFPSIDGAFHPWKSQNWI